VFSGFSRTPTCDRQTDTDTDGHTAIAYRPYRASIASRGKTLGSYDGSWLCSLIDLQYIGLYFVANMSDAKNRLFGVTEIF